MSIFALSSAALLSLGNVTADYGGSATVNNSSRYNRYDFVLTNHADEAQEVSVCPQDVVIAVQDHRTQSEPAFAVSFGDDPWSRDCTSRNLAAGERVLLRGFFMEWWPHESIARRQSKQITADTSAGRFIMNLTRADDRRSLRVQVSNDYSAVQ